MFPNIIICACLLLDILRTLSRRAKNRYNQLHLSMPPAPALLFLKIKINSQTCLEENDKTATMPLISPQASLSHGLETNVNGGTYRSGVAYELTKKIEVEETIFLNNLNSQNGQINVSEVSRSCHVSRGFVKKILREIESGGVVDPHTRQTKAQFGPGSRALDIVDEHVLLSLRCCEPDRSLSNYRRHLIAITGTDVSEATLYRFFLTALSFEAQCGNQK